MNTIKALLCFVVVTAVPASAELQIPTSFRIGPYGEMTSRPWFDPAVGGRSVLSIASVGEIRLDLGVRRPEFTSASGSLVRMLGGTVQYNALGGYPYRQWGLFGGYQSFFGAERGHEWLVGISTATSNARGEHAEYELSFAPRMTRGRRAHWVLRFKMIVLRVPPSLRRVPKPPPLRVVVDSVDAGGVPSNPRWAGARGKDVDRMCRFSYVQMSGIPVLVYRPECDTTGVATLNQPISPRAAKHGGLSCRVKDAEPIIRGHINWIIVNQTGRVRWRGFNPGSKGDHDFNLFLEAPQLVTRGNARATRRRRDLRDHPNRDSLIELEFSGDETARLFSAQHGGGLWGPLIVLPQLPAESPEYARQEGSADRLFRDRPAVITGLLGLDGVHAFQTELHPVLGLAVDVSHEVGDGNAHAWLVLLRNMGNEGECSAGQLPWVTADITRPNQYVIEIPWKAGADSVVVDADSSRFGFIARRMATLAVKLDPARAIRLVADLPRPTLTDSAGIVYGTLWLRWFHHGRPLANSAGVVHVADANQTPRQTRGPNRDSHDFEPVMAEAFPRTRRLCFKVERAEPVSRDPPSTFRPQTVLRDRPTRAPAVIDEDSCSGTGSLTAPR
jgi:hypothetical protein